MNFETTEKFRAEFDFNVVKADDENRIVEGFLSAPVIDSDGEIIPMEPFVQLMPVIMKRGGNVIEEHSNKICGKILAWKVMDIPQTCKVVKEGGNEKQQCTEGLWLKTEVFRDYPTDDETWNAIKNGEIKGFSFGGHVQKYQYECNKEAGGCYNKANGLSVFEVSYVRRPANPLAYFTFFNQTAKSQDGIKSLIEATPSLRKMRDEMVQKGMATTEAVNAVRCFVCKSLENVTVLDGWFTERENEIVKKAGLNSLDDFMNTCGFCKRKMSELKTKGLSDAEAKSQLRRIILKALVSYNKSGGENQNMTTEEKTAASAAGAVAPAVPVAEVKSQEIVKEAGIGGGGKDAVVGDALRELKEVIEKLASKLDELGRAVTRIGKPEGKPVEEKKPEEKKPEEKKPELPPALPKPELPKPEAKPEVPAIPPPRKEEGIGVPPVSVATEKIPPTGPVTNTDKEEELRRREADLVRRESELKRKEEELLMREEAGMKYASATKSEKAPTVPVQKAEGTEVKKYDPHRDPTDLIVGLEKELKKIYETYEMVKKAFDETRKALEYNPRENQGTKVLGEIKTPVRGGTAVKEGEGASGTETLKKTKEEEDEEEKKKKSETVTKEGGESKGNTYDPRASADAKVTLGKVSEVKDDIRPAPQKISAVLAARKALKSAKDLEERLKSTRFETASTPKPKSAEPAGHTLIKSAGEFAPSMTDVSKMSWEQLENFNARYQVRKRELR